MRTGCCMVYVYTDSSHTAVSNDNNLASMWISYDPWFNFDSISNVVWIHPVKSRNEETAKKRLPQQLLQITYFLKGRKMSMEVAFLPLFTWQGKENTLIEVKTGSRKERVDAALFISGSFGLLYLVGSSSRYSEFQTFWSLCKPRPKTIRSAYKNVVRH